MRCCLVNYLQHRQDPSTYDPPILVLMPRLTELDLFYFDQVWY